MEVPSRYIRGQAESSLNETASRVSAIKESALDLSKEGSLNKIESEMLHITKPITIILSGGTFLPKGFATRFRQILEHLKLHIPVGSVRRAAQPLRSVAKGALVAASADESHK